MICISKLDKVYKSKKRKTCKALDDVNLILPDGGLVFVLGKSGSGKSTLLNLIGGLDNITSGSIIVDGNDISSFKENEYCNYRNNHIGFIFQDYHLIDELTVYENICLSLNLKKQDDKEKVLLALEKVDLKGYENRFPTELSGGERQRVAIARAIVKKPRIILADEPTGNLDTVTSTQIIELLKALSKECLILIVSHNKNDAYKYGDRIIELSKGKIIKDESRNPEYVDEVVVNDNIIYYPYDKVLTDQEINLINNNISNDTKIVKVDKKYVETNLKYNNEEKQKIEKKSLSIFHELLLSLKFLKNKVFSIVFSSFMVSVIMVILALSQTIITFDSGDILEKEMVKSNQNSILMTQTSSKEITNQIGEGFYVNVEDEDISLFKESGYKGTIRKVYNYKISSSYSANYSFEVTNKFKGPYTTESLGHMIVDEKFLTDKFGDYEFIAKLDKEQEYGIYITDYLADCLISLNSSLRNKEYKDILGPYSTKNNYNYRYYINGVIETGYKEKYKVILDKIKNDKSLQVSELYENKEFQNLSNDIFDKLGYSYSFNENFFECVSKTMMSMYPETKVVVFDDLFEFSTTTAAPYITDSLYYEYFKKFSDEFIQDGTESRCYNKIPTIPENAKYIRVSYDTRFVKSDNPDLKESYPKLRFGNGELVSKDKMTYNKKQNNLGPQLDPWNGDIVYSTLGAEYVSVSDYVEIPEGEEISEFTSVAFIGSAFYAFYDENKNFIESKQASYGGKLPEKTVYMAYLDYNEAFKTEYKVTDLDKFIPHKVKLAHYEWYDVDRKNPIFEIEVTIAGLLDCTQTLITSQDITKLFQINQFAAYSLYFDGTEGIEKVIDKAQSNNYSYQSYSIEGIHTMTKAVDVFIPIFELIGIILCIGIIFILVNFSSKMIKDKMHEIGILKALGTQNKSIGTIFGLQICLIALLTIIMSTLGYFFFIDLANDVLIASLKELAPGHVVLDLDFLTFKFNVVLINVLLIIGLCLISLLVPLIKIKNIKPVKIIKAKE